MTYASSPLRPLPVVAVVGRPNVGKSTLFNRLVGKRLALVDDRPGVTRDRREGEGRLGDLTFRIVDTAGLENAAEGSLEARMRAQTEAAIAEADIILFMVDARAGVTADDERFADVVRRAMRPVILLANKAEGRAGVDGAYDSYRLGLGDPLPVSAEHAEGLGDLYDALAALMPEPDDEDEEAEGEGAPLRIAIVGRPNAGKSTLVNRLVGSERMLTGPEAGITRDSVSIDWEWRGRRVRLVDTAGLRRKARVIDKLEKLSVADAIRSIKFAEVVVVLLDATIPFEKQDLSIADLVTREGRALVIGLNKWDLVENRNEQLKAHGESLERLLPQVKGVPLVPLAGQTGEGVDRLMTAIIKTHEVWNRRVSTAALNRWLEEVLERHPPPAVAGKRIKLRYATQPKARPPYFVIFGTRTEELPDSYVRYLTNGLRETFDLPGVPIRVTFRQPDNPYDKK
ncbi:ribosome biogenesis GTPase Der [Methylopila sp. 73B]|uniref:ribosome biogenesis GTPase Der n=1 Tax=Methylopila sp. 73B TaxID=1120792 RepID=UPI00037304BE|nr:ribosome biogenesis GTPase Der [Methylopila sp. 73B]